MHRLHLLGRADLLAADGSEVRTVVTQPRRFAVLAYLAMTASTGPSRRDKLLGLFWPELTQERARKALNKTVHFLRQALGESVIVSRGAEELTIDATQLWCDASTFADAVQGGRMSEALALYSGELLPSFYIEDGAEFESWLADERARLRRLAARASQSLAQLREGEGQFTTAIALARRAAELADEDERAVRQLLELLDRLGDRAGALYAYDRFARRLAMDFGAEPSAETRALIERVRERSEPQPAPVRVAAAAPSPAPPPYTAHSEQSLVAALHSRGYAIERELGRGGMATVYLAQDLKHDRKVAIKVLAPEVGALRLADRFAAEIRVTARLQHPNILPLFDSGSVDGMLFYVMPCVQGESLRARLQRDKQLPVDEVIAMVRALAGALEHAHDSGVVHRDIKPENILLKNGNPLLADFGIALALSHAGVERITSTGLLLGTPQYMSPEQAAGELTVGPQSDIYSLAAVAYEILAGEPPFTGPNTQAVLARVMLEAPRPIRVVRSTVPETAESAILRALSKHHADRFTSAADFAMALTAPSEASTAPTSRGSRRRWTYLGLGTLAVTTAALLAVQMPAAPVYVPGRVVVVPLENQTGDAAFDDVARQLLAGLPDAIAREGVGEPVPAATVRDLLPRAPSSPGRAADWLARETGAGVQLRGACSRTASGTTCQVDVVRMPSKVLRMSVSVTGDASQPAYDAELTNRLLVALFLQQRWGDQATWRGEYLPSSLAAVRAYTEYWERHDAMHVREAARLDTGWVEAVALAARHSGDAAAESTWSRLSYRPDLLESERQELEFIVAEARGDSERLFELAKRRFPVNPKAWVAALTYHAMATGRPATAIAVSKDADSVPSQIGRNSAYHNRGYAFHHLGRYEDHLLVARKYGQLRPEAPAGPRGQEVMAFAGLGMVDSIRRRLAEWEASPEPSRGPAAGTRAYIAGFELMAHGHEREGREVLASTVPLYYRLRAAEGYHVALPEVLMETGRLAEAHDVARADLPKATSGEDSATFLSLLGAVAARQGKTEEARRYLEELVRYRLRLAARRQRPDLQGQVTYRLAVLAGWMGDREAAVRFLEEARALGRAQHWFVHRQPAFAAMRDYPPYQQFLKPRD